MTRNIYTSRKPYPGTIAAIIGRYNDAGRVAYGGSEPTGESLARAYKFHRACGSTPHDAVIKAGDDVSHGRSRWPSSRTYHMQAGATFGDNLRWIERPDLGLRFVGFADEITRLDHTGYYTRVDDDGYTDGETLRGAVYRLPAKRGRSRYLAGYREGSESRKHGWQDMAGSHGAALHMSTITGDRLDYDSGTDDARESGAASVADSIADSAAESQRDYNRAYDAGSLCAALQSEAIDERDTAATLATEIRALDIGDSPATRSALCDALKRHKRNARDAASKARDLLDTYGAARVMGERALHINFNGDMGPMQEAFAAGHGDG